MRRLLAPALLVALAGCNSDFEPQYRVADLRILAVRSAVEGSGAADPTADDTVALDALVANPRGRAPLEVRWYACLPSGTDAVPPCIDDAVLADPDRIATAPGVLALPVASGTGEHVTVDLTFIPAAVVKAAFDAVTARAAEQPTFLCRAFVELPVIAIARAEGRRDVALKRVRIAPRAEDVPAIPAELRYAPNVNPRIVRVLRGDTTTSGCTGADIRGSPFPAGLTTLCGQADAVDDRYLVCDESGNPSETSESYGWQWYVTAGEFPDEAGVGNATDADPDFERAAGAFTMWTILRDGRGGEDWLRIDVPAL
jgi:hypothetical protein